MHLFWQLNKKYLIHILGLVKCDSKDPKRNGLTNSDHLYFKGGGVEKIPIYGSSKLINCLIIKNTICHNSSIIKRLNYSEENHLYCT